MVASILKFNLLATRIYLQTLQAPRTGSSTHIQMLLAMQAHHHPHKLSPLDNSMSQTLQMEGKIFGITTCELIRIEAICNVM
jgi:hypothetical protein